METANSGIPMCVRPISITLEQMPQQEKIETQEDDWTGQTNQAERRRRQNRLNQRAYRKRKEAEAKSALQQPYSHRKSSYSFLEELNSTTTQNQDQQDIGPWQTFSTAVSSPKPQLSVLSQVAILLNSDYEKTDKAITQFKKWISKYHMTSSPTADHLLVLIKLNIFRALINNAVTLGFAIETTLDDNALSPFTAKSTYKNHLAANLKLPSTLRPTTIQCQVPHHPWLDLFPVPRMRDNLILAEDSYDDLQLCEDLCGLFNQKSNTGLIIWGEPWDPAGWEITPQFLKRWAWVLKGCTELMVSTNYWREKRRETPLNFEGFEEKGFEIY